MCVTRNSVKRMVRCWPGGEYDVSGHVATHVLVIVMIKEAKINLTFTSEVGRGGGAEESAVRM
jgi:hypothetical protein